MGHFRPTQPVLPAGRSLFRPRKRTCGRAGARSDRTVRATWSNGSSIGSNSVGGSRRATTNPRPTTWPSFSSHQYGCGFVLMSPRPQAKRPFRNWLSGVQLSNMRDLTFQNPTSKIPKSVMPIEAAPRLNNACEWSPRFYLFFANDRYPLPKRECVV